MWFSVAPVKSHWFGINWHVFNQSECRNCCLYIIIQKIAPQAKSGKYFQICFFPRFGGKNGGVLSMRMQVILDSSFARPGSAPIYGAGRKGSSGTGLAAKQFIVEASVSPGIWMVTSNLKINTQSTVGCNKSLKKWTGDIELGINSIDLNTKRVWVK